MLPELKNWNSATINLITETAPGGEKSAYLGWIFQGNSSGVAQEVWSIIAWDLKHVTEIDIYFKLRNFVLLKFSGNIFGS